VDLHELLDTAIRLAGSDYDLKKNYDFKQIEIKRHYDLTLSLVKCDKTEIEQVVLNLIKNAAQAMSSAAIPAPAITLRTHCEHNYACIEVSDNGPGMDAKTSKRVFEPFFTTKEVGIGTGLGLSVSYFIITEQHKGTLSVTSKPGEGTCFVICLPLSN
jgi:signal transduction histidine kinase